MQGAYFRQDVSASNMSQISVMSGNWLFGRLTTALHSGTNSGILELKRVF